MLFHESEENEASLVQEPIALQELEEEAVSLACQRKHLDDQRALLDLERAEVEQRLAELEFQSALLDALSTRLDFQEAVLASDYEGVRLTGRALARRKPRGFNPWSGVSWL